MSEKTPKQPDTMLVRIGRGNRRELHAALGYEIRKTDGWVEIPTAVALELAKERMSELNPTASPFVFDVVTHEQAAATHAAETAREEPAGTPTRPKVATQVRPDGAAARDATRPPGARR
jgi:hypothetical protein